jgi:hypothetical protein
MRARTIPQLVVFALGVVLLSTAPAWSQATTSGSVSGQVTDQSGGVIPGAEVILVDAATQSQLRTASNAAGRYVMVNVASGHYVLKVTHEGFTSENVSNIEVTIGANVVVNAQLKVGSTKETVTVEAQTITELQTTNATVGNTIDSKSIQLLPNLGRDVSTLAALQPAVTGAGYTAGANYDQNTYRLDGGNITDDMGGQTISYQQNMTGTGGTQENGYASGVIPTPIESIEEMKVSVAGSGIDFNSSAGANVQMVTKRGTNAFHGSLYEYYFDTSLGAANSWANDHTCVAPGTTTLLATPAGAGGNCPISGGSVNPIVSNHRNRFGFAVGGPVIKRKILGGSTYFFYNMEFLRFPNLSAFERPVPTPLLRAGVLQVPNAAGVYTAYNLNTTPVTVGGVTYAPVGMGCGTAAAPSLCDPRSLGMSPLVNTIWNKYMPLPNDSAYSGGDQYNTQGYLSAIRQTQTSNYLVGRVDHDFGDKNRFFASYRYFDFHYLTSNQNDIGGGLPGDTNGTPAATAPRPQKPTFLIFGLTSNLSSNITNDLRIAYTRSYWQWFDASPLTNPLIPGEGGGPEIGGESATALIPYNINTQSTRTRFWDGQDKQLNDNISHLHGNHLFQYGFGYQRDNDYHSRNDNGSTIDVNPTYLISSPGSGSFTAANIPIGLPSSSNSTYETYYSEILGLVSQSQVTYSRSGAALNLLPQGTQAFDRSIIPYYSWYWGDTWHIKPTLTVVYGMAYAIEMPPNELNGKQINLVDASGNEISAANYLAAKQSAALQGQNYNPQIGYALVGNIGSGLKYPYNPFYGGWSPRAAAAWNPSFSDGILGKIFGQGKTVIRGGYTRIYGRLNGVDQVLVPLLGPGFLQGVACADALSNGTCGTGVPTPANIFRFGPDGVVAPLAPATPTLPQPYFPGSACAACFGGNPYPNAGDVNTLDPDFKPSRSDQFTLSIQRQISRKVTVDVGYIGRISKNDFQEINLDAVPTMFTLGGQTFASAYGSLYTSVCTLGSPTCTGNAINSATGAVTAANNSAVGTIAAQPFFENALGGATSAYCKGFANCTTAVAVNNLTSLKSNSVSPIWQSLNNASSWVPGKTTMSENGQVLSANLSTSLGFSNYNALYVSTRMADYHGLTFQANFTWGRALGTAGLAQLNSSNTSLNPWSMQANYGPQSYDIPVSFNFIAYYQPPFFKNQRGPLGWFLGGWTIAPLFTAQSGNPAVVGAPVSVQFGEVAAPTSGDTSTADGNAVGISPYTGTNSRLIGVPTTSTCTTCPVSASGAAVVVGSNNPTGQGMYANPGAIYSQYRPCVLGVDTNCGGYTGGIRSEPVWNLDATVAKNFSILKEDKLGASLIFQVTNVLNHMQPSAPSLGLTGPTTFGRITSQANTPRNMEFGVRIHF